MGHGKETPRQKMIGMMYLVLTALLALNVSKSVLDAFVIVDKGLNKTVDNFSSKSEILYAALDKAAASNPAKAGELRDKSNKVKNGANELSLEIDKIKAELVLIADKVEVGLDTIRNYELNAKDNLDIGGQVMVLQKRGEELKAKINAYRDMMKELAPGDQGVNLRASLDQSLNTNDPEEVNEGGVKETWESVNFEHLPLVAVNTMLTKIQTDIRNAESDAVSYLFGQIGADDFRFNKIEAIVLPKSNYILKGDRYEADVFIAASDSTEVPEITVGGSQLTVKDGRGKYTSVGSGVGEKKWGGVIKLITPSKQVKEYPFKAAYMVGEPSATVSPTKMNVFYIGVDNPVEVLASGVAAENIKPTISAGSISPDGGGGKYTVRVKKTGDVSISINAMIDGKTTPMGTKKFRVKTVPDPVAVVNKEKGGIISKGVLQAQAGVAAELENFDFDLRFIVQSFSVSATIKGYEEEYRSNSYQFTPQQKQLIGKLQTGSKVYISDIQAMGPDKTLRSLSSIAFKLK